MFKYVFFIYFRESLTGFLKFSPNSSSPSPPWFTTAKHTTTWRSSAASSKVVNHYVKCDIFFFFGQRIIKISTNKNVTFSFTGLPDLKKVVVIPYARSKHEADISKIPNRCVCVCVCLCLCIDMTTEQQTLFKKKNCVTHMQNLTTTLKNKNGIKNHIII